MKATVMKAKKTDSVLLVVDVQERLADTMIEKERLIDNVKALVHVAKVFRLPVLTTEQEKLGETVPELREALAGQPKIRKLEFSCCQNAEFSSLLDKPDKRSIIVCGIEAHICVLQTVLDLIANHYPILVIRDAVSSYSIVDRDAAIERMRDSGAVITTTEAVIYELTEKAGTEEFRRILEIVKERRKSLSEHLADNRER
jgi:nicotinamidase-related amidase